jgi:PmbA protein
MDAEFWKDRLKGSFDSYEVSVEKERTRTFQTMDGALLSKEVKEEEGISLRGIKAGRMVFSYTFEKGEKGVAALLENARTLLPFIDEDPSYAFSGASSDYPSLDLYDDRGLKADEEGKIQALIDMESLVRAFDSRITATRNCELHESEIEVSMVNSNGLDVRAAKTVYALSGMAVAAEGSEEVSWYDWAWSPRYGELAPKVLGNRIAEKTVSFLSGQILDTGTYTGLLTPACACQILEILSPSFLAENLYKNKTRLKDKNGQRVFSDALTIVDSGLRGIGAFPFDGEGVPSGENTLVREGVFEGFLYNIYYANRLGTRSTGNGVRSGVKDPPRCGTRGFYVSAGSDAVGPGHLGKGIVIEELMGTHMANPVTGDFSLGAIGHYYSGGTKTPFKGVVFSGNLFDTLSNVRATGKDLTFYGSYGSPSLLVEGLKISGK